MSKTVIGTVLGIVGGVGIGSGVTYFLFKKRFDSELDEAVEQVKDFYKKRSEQQENVTKTTMTDIPSKAQEPDPVEQDSILDFEMDSIATNYSSKSVTPTNPETFSENNDISIIDEDTYFGAIANGADPVEYLWYADHILADENSDVVDNIETLVGREALSIFGDDGVDSVYVHNKRLNMYIEILRSERSYKEDYAYKL